MVMWNASRSLRLTGTAGCQTAVETHLYIGRAHTVKRLPDVLQRQQTAELARLGLGRHAAQPGAEYDSGYGILDHA